MAFNIFFLFYRFNIFICRHTGVALLLVHSYSSGHRNYIAAVFKLNTFNFISAEYFHDSMHLKLIVIGVITAILISTILNLLRINLKLSKRVEAY